MDWGLWGTVALAVAIGLVLGAALARAVAHGRRLAAEVRAEEAQRRSDVLGRERDDAIAARIDAETEVAVARQRLADMQARIEDFERLRDESLKANQAAVLSAARELSSKLIEDHKRENEAAKAAGEARVKQATETLAKQLETVAGAVSQIQGQMNEKARVIDTVWRALTNPSGAGQFAEIGLANTLTSFGLVEGRDFDLQHSVEGDEPGRRLRPDAVVYLPGDGVMVIDSKASKFLVELAAAPDAEGEEAALKNLARSMNQHLKGLADRDYRNAVAAAWRRNRPDATQPARVLSVMYLPNETALETLGRADPDFPRKAAEAQIIPAGPAGLASMIGFASIEISLMRQVENQERIVQGAEALLDAVGVVMVHAAGVGRGIKSAAEAFAKLSGSTNARLLPRARALARLGLRPGKPLPGNLPAYQVLTGEGETLIEGETTDVASEVVALPRPAVA